MSTHTTERSERNCNPEVVIQITGPLKGQRFIVHSKDGNLLHVSLETPIEGHNKGPEWSHKDSYIPAKTTPDFTVNNQGSIFILTGQTEACREWIEENVGDNQTQTWGQHGIVVEHRYIQDIVDGLRSEGFIGEVI